MDFKVVDNRAFYTRNGWTKAKILEHIKTNFKGKSYEGLRCHYRTPDNTGRKCAVGLFIPDEMYQGVFWSMSANYLLTEYPDVRKSMPLSTWGMQKFQLVHDQSRSEETLADMLRFINDNVVDSAEEGAA